MEVALAGSGDLLGGVRFRVDAGCCAMVAVGESVRTCRLSELGFSGKLLITSATSTRPSTANPAIWSSLNLRHALFLDPCLPESLRVRLSAN